MPTAVDIFAAEVRDNVLTALSYANDDVNGARREVGEPELTEAERLATITDLLDKLYAKLEAASF